jgi:predicted transcriptional regulator
MRLSEVTRKLEAEEIVAPKADVEIKNICASDLLSDILATDKYEFLILTGLTTPQVIRTAEIVGALGVVIVGGKYPGQGLIGLAKAHQIPLYVTKMPMFESCVKLSKVIECRGLNG